MVFVPEVAGKPLPEARFEPRHPGEGDLVAGVRHEAQVREHVLDVALLEETQPRADLVRYVPPGQLDLELERVRVVPVQDRNLGEGEALVDLLEDPLRHESRLRLG